MFVLLTEAPWWYWFIEHTGTGSTIGNPTTPSSTLVELFGWLASLLVDFGTLLYGVFACLPPFLLPIAVIFIAVSVVFLIVGRG